jgi:transposase
MMITAESNHVGSRTPIMRKHFRATTKALSTQRRHLQEDIAELVKVQYKELAALLSHVKLGKLNRREISALTGVAPMNKALTNPMASAKFRAVALAFAQRCTWRPW